MDSPLWLQNPGDRCLTPEQVNSAITRPFAATQFMKDTGLLIKEK